jgi:hypothetical protein
MRKNTKKVATNLPKDLLELAASLSGLNQTQTIIEGLKELIRKERVKKFLSFEGKIQIGYEVDKLRERKKRHLT